MIFINKHNWQLFFILSVTILSLSYGCKKKDKETSTTTSPAETAPTVVTQPVEFNNADALAIFDQLDATELMPRTLTARTNVHFIGGGFDQSLGADLRLQTDKALWVSLYTDFGIKIELARALITPDSVKVVNRFQKQYTTESTQYLQRLVGYPLTFADLQAIVLGHQLNKPNAADTLHIETTDKGEYHLWHQSNNLKTDNYTTNSNPQLLLLRIAIDDLFNNRQMNLQLSDYTTIDQKPFAQKRQISFDNNKQKYNATLQLNDIETNKSVEMSFSIPKSYARVK